MIPVKEEIARGAQVKSAEEYQDLYRKSLEDPEGFWREQSKRLDWVTPPEKIMQADMNAAEFRWYDGGQLNAAYNCVDRHAAKTPDKTAIIWAKNEPGDYEQVTFAELSERVQRVANVLKAQGVGKGDRVCIYLPMVPELAYTMLACARIGAIHSIVFAGFSAEALNQRIVDAQAKLVVTADEGLRGAKTIPLKKISDDAVKNAPSVEKVLVVRRTGGDAPFDASRDVWLHEAMASASAECAPEVMEAEDPLFILYTSGSTGKPKGLLHTTGGYLVYAALTHEYVFDIHDDTVYFCAADIGWITGHSYIVYGPLANGTTTVLFESIPTYPNPSRYWEVCKDLQANVLYTSPTALRALMREGDDWVTKVPRDSLRVLGTVGEPINPEVWQWYHDVVGDKRMPIVDTWWQTETGGILITPLPGATPMKPGSATLPFFGIEPILVDEKGDLLEGNDVAGMLCMARAWPGQARTIYGDHQRYKDTYYARFPGRYFTGDGCRRDEDGYYWITGRVDDVVNVSGHRIGTAEVESALVAHPSVAEAAVVGFPHDIKGQGIYAYVVLRSDVEYEHDALVTSLKQEVRKHIGPIATPDHIRLTGGLPKTRSGKIMRRILRKIANGQTEDLGDTSTLADPTVVDTLLKPE